MAEPRLEFTHKGGPLYVPPPEEPEEPILIGDLMEQMPALEQAKPAEAKATQLPAVLTATAAGDYLLNSPLNKAVDKLPLGGASKYLKNLTGALPQVLPQAGRWLATRGVPGVGTYMLAEDAYPYVVEQSKDQVDHIMDTGALQGSHMSNYDDEALKEMARDGNDQASEILMNRTRIDGIPRPYELPAETIYDQIEASKAKSADSMESVDMSNALVRPEFTSEEEFNKWDTDGSGMLSDDEVRQYRYRVNRHEVNIDDL